MFPVLNIIHEDADLLVVNKPAGLVCHPTKNGEMSSLIGRARLHLNFSLNRRRGRRAGVRWFLFRPISSTVSTAKPAAWF